MLLPVRTRPLRLAAFDGLVRDALAARIEALGRSLRGLRVVHVNATPSGGGVAEILRSLVPLSRSVGIDAHWYVLPPDDGFFEVTRRIHNALQGRPGRMGPPQRRAYLGYLERLAGEMRSLAADVWVVHDPQPLPLGALVPLRGATIWRCHIDSAAPNACVRDYLLPWVRAYDAVVFSMPGYVLPGLWPDRVRVIPPAIDPLSPKNRPLAPAEIDATLARLGVDPRRPLATQVSRFDSWKNPWQAVEAYRLARRAIPGLQLALLGVFSATDDPEAPRVYRSVRRLVGRDPDVHLFTDPGLIGPREVNAFQAGSAVVLQRSVREGFGLTVSEAMWKARPVVATPVGGITIQIRDGQSGFLVTGTEACAERMVRLARDPALAAAVGRAARRTVRDHFLLPRLLRDDLLLYGELVASEALSA